MAVTTITLDTYKQQIGSQDAFNLSDSFNGRVGDEQVPLVVVLKERGILQQFADDLQPFMSGFVGELDENGVVTADTGVAVSYHGSRSDVIGLGKIKMNLPGTMFPRQGYFYGFLGLENAEGKRVTTFNIWFHVYNGNPDMFVNKEPFRTELQKLLDAAQALIDAADGEVKAKLLEWQTQINQLITNLNGDYASIQLLVTGLQSQLDDIAQKIKDGNIVTAKDLTDWQTLMEQKLNAKITLDSDMAVGGFVDGPFKDEVDRVKSKLTDGLFTIGIMNDTHYQTDVSDKPYAYLSINHIRNLLEFSDKADVLLLNGDNTNSGMESLDGVKKDIDRLSSVFFEAPAAGDADRFMQLGNHDDGSTRRLLATPYRFLAQDNYLHDDYFKKMYRTSSADNQGEVRQSDSLYFYKDYPDKKVRLISLNTSDILEGELDATGSQKQDRWGTLAIRQEQLNWFANVALAGVPAGYHIVVVSHCPLDATFTHGTDASSYWNLDVVSGVLAACRDGVAYSGSSTLGNYPVSITVDYTNQGPRPVVGNFAGHFHTEWIHDYIGFKVVEIHRSLLYEAESDQKGTAKEDRFDIIQIDTANRHVYIYGYGGATDRGYDY